MEDSRLADLALTQPLGSSLVADKRLGADFCDARSLAYPKQLVIKRPGYSVRFAEFFDSKRPPNCKGMCLMNHVLTPSWMRRWAQIYVVLQKA
jgi:hypothetical protein